MFKLRVHLGASPARWIDKKGLAGVPKNCSPSGEHSGRQRSNAGQRRRLRRRRHPLPGLLARLRLAAGLGVRRRQRAAAVLGPLRRLGRRLAAVLADAAVGLGHRGGRAALRPERRRVLGDAALGRLGRLGLARAVALPKRRRVHRAVGADGRLAARERREVQRGRLLQRRGRRRRRRRRRGVGAPVQRVQQRRRRRRRRRLGAAVQRVRRVLGLLRRRRQGRRRRRVRRLVQGRRLRRRLGVQGEWWGAPAVGPLEAERRGVQRGCLLRGWLLGLLGWRQEERRVHREPAAVGDGRERHQVLGGDGRQVRVVLQV